MTDDIIDANHVNPDAWDTETRVRISDAIIEVNDHLRKVKLGRYLLVGIAFFIVLGTALLLLTAVNEIPDGQPGAVSGVIATVVYVLPFVVFAVLYPRNPLLFLILGLAFYLLMEIVLVVLTGGDLLDGYLLKIAIISAFGYSIYSVTQWMKNLKRLRELGYPSSALTMARKGLSPLPRLRKRKR